MQTKEGEGKVAADGGGVGREVDVVEGEQVESAGESWGRKSRREERGGAVEDMVVGC